MAITIRMITDYFVFILMEVFERQHDMRMKSTVQKRTKKADAVAHRPGCFKVMEMSHF